MQTIIVRLQFCVVFLCMSVFLMAQTPALLSAQTSTHPAAHSWEPYLESLIAADEDNALSWQDTYEILTEMEDHPLDINTIQREDLERFPFLSEQQISDICEYVDRYGPVRSMAELMMIESLDAPHRQLLQCFLYIGAQRTSSFPSLRNIAKYGRQELIGSLNVPFYKRKGDNTAYMGYPYKHWLRYQFTYGDYVKMGLLGSQDAGEPFGGHNSLGYDFYSFYFQLRHLGVLQNFTLGRYRVSFGQGLVVSTDFSFGKSAMLATMGRTLNHVSAHSSRSSANYLQGVAATFQLFRGLTLTTFGSCRYVDATLNPDGTVATVLTDGYHRTAKEMEKKNNTMQELGGAHLYYFSHGFHAGATALYTHYNRPLAPNTATLYRRYNPIGSDFLNVGVDYGYTRSQFSFQGETAADRHGAIATVHSANMRLTRTLTALLLHRFYSCRYTALFANSFSDGGEVRNESGLYAGVHYEPSRILSLSAYGDYAYHPWAKYRTSQSSSAFDSQLSATCQLSQLQLMLRYRLRIREYDNADKTALISHRQQQVHGSITWTGARHFTANLQLHGTVADFEQRDWGYMANGEIGYVPTDDLRLYGQFNYFHTTSYESRIYSYERDLLYCMSVPAYYDEGIRYALLARMSFWKKLIVQAKWGVTDYFHRTVIGSGNQQINASSMSDLALLVKYKF